MMHRYLFFDRLVPGKKMKKPNIIRLSEYKNAKIVSTNFLHFLNVLVG